MTNVSFWQYLGIVGLLGLLAFFSGSEIAFAKANRMRLRAATEEGNVLSKIAYYIYQSYDNALVTILIGNNLVNIAASSVATVIAIALMGDSGAWVATLAMTVLIIIFGEIVPKIVASQVPEGFAKAVSIPLRALMTLLFPLVWVLSLLLKGVDRLLKKRVGETPSVTEED
ncbi:MAG TPA: CNNM domain-containing protein, partial [Clostridia bacterium]|nr:CNNM domain-containing protein [Clostridia bacterium]